MAINGIRSIGVADPRRLYGGAGAEGVQNGGFAQHLQQAMGRVDAAQTNRDQMVEGMVMGEVGEVHDVMIAAEEAQLSLELMIEVRNKLLEGYQSIMAMQV
ncbi:MAG TPA: flagellar hook-basal body complex protein FliE [Candidatus Krumholzibacteria bacterium]|nr:flagellar hook-basal body complex protein FliE [Candidatus Krumholzibacteria bacterium]HRX50910.1 flagellar hook-basal body complex protein FliE [Candidatus Krumholzibacteria bacterium]